MLLKSLKSQKAEMIKSWYLYTWVGARAGHSVNSDWLLYSVKYYNSALFNQKSN